MATPIDLGFTVAYAAGDRFLMHVKTQFDIVPSGSGEAICYRDISRGAIEIDSPPMGDRIRQSCITIVLGLDRDSVGMFFEPQEARICLCTPQKGPCHFRLIPTVHARSVVCGRTAKKRPPLRI